MTELDMASKIIETMTPEMIKKLVEEEYVAKTIDIDRMIDLQMDHIDGMAICGIDVMESSMIIIHAFLKDRRALKNRAMSLINDNDKGSA